MHEITTIENPCICIVHFRAQEIVEAQGGHLPRYQIVIDDNTQYSPSGDFVRFNYSTSKDETGQPIVESELHGWMRADDIVIDEILEHIQEAEEVA